MPYVLSHGRSPHGTDWIHESAAECYLPLLDVLDRLEREGIQPHWTIGVTPILAEQLADPGFADSFRDYCESKIDAAREDALRFRLEGPLWMQGLACLWERAYRHALEQFERRWKGRLLTAFRHFQEIGAIEILTSCATHGYLPLLGTDASVSAQVALGVQTYRRHFGRDPRGIWLPECAYRPSYAWKPPVGPGEPFPRVGVETILAEQGLEYFFIDSHLLRGGEPLGTYAAQFPQLAELFARSRRGDLVPPEERNEYEAYRLPAGPACFARDPQTTVKVWSGESGYPGDPRYLEFHKQLYPGRLRYWRISENKRDLGAKGPYDPYAAYERIRAHADDFLNTVRGALATHKGRTEREGTLVAMYDTELFGHWWWEGPQFLYEVARRLASQEEVRPVTGSEALEIAPPRPIHGLPEGSWGEGGYHHIWLNEENAWTWERLYSAERAWLDRLARPHAPENPWLLQAARELLLAEASDWQFLISTRSARDYAELRFTDHLDRFERLLNLSSESARPSSKDEAFLDECRLKDAPFQSLSLGLWDRARLGPNTP